MKYTRMMAIFAVGLMLAVPMAVLTASDSDLSAADPKNKVVDGSSAYLLKSSKEIKYSDANDFVKEYVKAILADNIYRSMGMLTTDKIGTFGGVLPSQPFTAEFKLELMESGAASKASNNTCTSMDVTKMKGEITYTYKDILGISTKTLFDEDQVMYLEAASAYRKYFGDVKNVDAVIKIPFDIETSIEREMKYINIGDGTLVINADKLTMRSLTNISNATFNIGDKTMTVNVSSSQKLVTGVDFKISSSAALSDKPSFAASIFDSDISKSYKYRFGDSEKDYGYPVEDIKEGYSYLKAYLESDVNIQRKTAISDVKDIIGNLGSDLGDSGSTIVMDRDIKNSDCSAVSVLGEQAVNAFMDVGCTLSDKYDDVQGEVNSVAQSEPPKSQLFYIGIAVLIAVVVGAIVFVVMKKNSWL